MDGSAFVGQRCQKRSTPTVTAGTLKPRALVEQGKRLCQAVGVESGLDALLTGKERVAAIHTPGLCSVGCQLLPQPHADKHSASVSLNQEF